MEADYQVLVTLAARGLGMSLDAFFATFVYI